MPILRNRTNKDDVLSSRKIVNKLNQLDDNMNSLYSDIYLSRSDNRHNMEAIIDKIDTSFDHLQDNEVSVSGMSELLRRMEEKSTRGNSSSFNSIYEDVSDIFGNKALLYSLFQNEDIHRYISAQNYQYDMICRYLPKLEDALNIIKDNVLCSDNFSKKFINPKNNKTNKNDAQLFSSNVKKLDLKYDLDDFFTKVYNRTSKYGEAFIYIVPYKLAFERFLQRKSNISNGNYANLNYYSMESFSNNISSESFIINENYTESNDFKEFIHDANISQEDLKGFKGNQVTVNYNTSNIITDKIEELYLFDSKKSLEKLYSLQSIFENSNSISDTIKNNAEKFDKLSNSSDGLIVPDSLKNEVKIDDNINGAVAEILDRENIIPIYIGKKCFGYYYFNFAEDPSACDYCGGHHDVPGLSNANNNYVNLSDNQRNIGIQYIASRLSANIDSKFINANKDLKEEIYSILYYNDRFDLNCKNNITVSFIPAEDIIHSYFELNEKTHRGISDLQKSVIPAMLYILLYLTDIIGKITRSTDKRIYYVKQNVETNVARTMMNVIAQIKKGNMGMRQIESMNNILNIVGKYNDYIIPLGQSGEAPIQFEVMNGQEINTPTDIMEKMEDLAVGSTGVPLEMVHNTYNQDFAVRYTMSNITLLRMVQNRQSVVEKIFSRCFTKIYNYEFNEKNQYISIILPPPIYMSLMNNSQLIDNVNQLVDKIIETELYDKSDEVKNEFKKLYSRSFLSSYIDFDSVENYIKLSEVSVSVKIPPATEDGDGANDDMSEYM